MKLETGYCGYPDIEGGVPRYEDDISAEDKTESKSSWLQIQNEYSWWKKSIGCQKSKRKKTVIRLGRIYVAFYFLIIFLLGVSFCS